MGVRRMHREAHWGGSAPAPATLALRPAKIIDTHTACAVATNAELVHRSLCPEVQVVRRMLEDAEWGNEVIVCSWTTVRHKRCTDHLPDIVWRCPEVNEYCLHVRAPSNHHTIRSRTWPHRPL